MYLFAFIFVLIGCGYGENDKGGDEPAQTEQQPAPVDYRLPESGEASPSDAPPAQQNEPAEPADEPAGEYVYPEPTEEQAARKRYVDNAMSTLRVGDSLQDILPEARELLLNAACEDWYDYGPSRPGLRVHACVVSLSEGEEYNPASWYYWRVYITSESVIDAI